MLFNSLIYLCLFLPLTVLGYYILGSFKVRWMTSLWLVCASLLFYAYWVPVYLPILLSSIVVNYSIGRLICKASDSSSRKVLLVLGLAFNIGLLGYFKYADFFIENAFFVIGFENARLLHLALPLGISFFTFQQIAFLVDSYHTGMQTFGFLHYSLFVSFFPQLVAGPIVLHKEMMPQIMNVKRARINWKNIYVGLFLIAIGLFKKIAVADAFAIWACEGFASPDSLDVWRAWRTSLSYTIQIYFDFSGYTDMALGSARLFNIRLPRNFNSPYLASDIQDFWRRWHITLGRFLKNYIYFPIGGSRSGTGRTCYNLFITFLIGGFWHGAGWTFIAWGALHGGAMVAHRLWKTAGLRLPSLPAWLLTFMFVNVAWVYFRAPNIETAHTVLARMTDFDLASLASGVEWVISGRLFEMPSWLPLLCLFILQDLLFRNSQEWADACRPNVLYSGLSAFLFGVGVLLLMNQNRFSEFLYFQF